MAKTKKRAVRKKAAKQAYLDDGDGNSMAPPRVEELDAAIEEYLDSKFDVAEARNQMATLKSELIPDLMKKHKITGPYKHDYRGTIYQAKLTTKEGCSVEKAPKSEMEG